MVKVKIWDLNRENWISFNSLVFLKYSWKLNVIRKYLGKWIRNN